MNAEQYQINYNDGFDDAATNEFDLNRYENESAYRDGHDSWAMI